MLFNLFFRQTDRLDLTFCKFVFVLMELNIWEKHNFWFAPSFSLLPLYLPPPLSPSLSHHLIHSLSLALLYRENFRVCFWSQSNQLDVLCCTPSMYLILENSEEKFGSGTFKTQQNWANLVASQSNDCSVLNNHHLNIDISSAKKNIEDVVGAMDTTHCQGCRSANHVAYHAQPGTQFPCRFFNGPR